MTQRRSAGGLRSRKPQNRAGRKMSYRQQLSPGGRRSEDQARGRRNDPGVPPEGAVNINIVSSYARGHERTPDASEGRDALLLTAQDLGDRKPSQLLRGMRQLLGEKASKMDDSLQRLPANVCMILAAAGDLPLDDLAALADRVLEVATPAISAFEGVKATEVSPVTSTENCSAELQSLKQEVQRIAKSLEALKI
ncbi:hypothetical protein HPB52_009805 [Rhipicephalus sanguineus]|uniref:Uncharacterized protein n=1 Tax=Rhipicephalus sanguineus TaxID=34632 RepID=A0A9D4Q5W8_RHISA|nr:hypothetical protein HPB52_009805 [Rhipicephalus sanguineus]